jgi:ATP-dependent Lhr-like helicase
VAQFLVGFDFDQPRDCAIVDVSSFKKINIGILSPVHDMMTTAYPLIHESLYRLLDQLIQDHRTTLIFTNTRAGTERVVHHLKETYPKHYTGIDQEAEETPEHALEERTPKAKETPALGTIGAHHGSLSKELRVDIENRLRNGDLKAVVSSTSLELGIDIGYIDLVLLIGSPKSIARALQRIGRSGHKLHDTAKGRMIVLDRDDLVECAVLQKGMIEKKIDTITVPKCCLDVLAQQLVGMVVTAKEPLELSDVYQLVKRAYSYHTLSYGDFLQVITYLAGHHASLEERNVYGKIWYDETTNTIGKRGKFARVLFMTNVGTIPDETNVKVRIFKKGSDGFRVGTISEQFLEKLKRGDIFVLGGNTFEFLYAQGLTAFVKASVGRTPTVPSWSSEMLPLSYELALSI